MSPVWIIEGRGSPVDPIAERNAAERKLTALAQAVREHEHEIGGEQRDRRPPDQRLYHRLREICDEPGSGQVSGSSATSTVMPLRSSPRASA